MDPSGWQKVNQVLGSLRCGQIDEQCESIVKLPGIFEEHPFPILIDAVYLKLGELFRECNNNFIRYCILKVITSTIEQQSKITGKDVYLRPILSVTHSNDAVARSITLRVLGVSAALFPDRKNVLHAIVRGLDSYMELERDAALFACKEYASRSQDVCRTVVPKLKQLLSDLSSTETLKVQILGVFQGMKYDIETAGVVKELCVTVLTEQSTVMITTGCLHVLTHIVISTLSNARQIIDIIFSCLVNEMRGKVRDAAFLCVEKVAIKQPELITDQDIEILVNIRHHKASKVLSKISKTPSRTLLTDRVLKELLAQLGSSSLNSAVSIYQICCNMMPLQATQVYFYPLLVQAIQSQDIVLVRTMLLSFSRQHTKIVTSSPLAMTSSPLDMTSSPLAITSSPLFSLLKTCQLPVFIELCYCLSSLRDKLTITSHDVTEILPHSDVERGCYFVKLLMVLYSRSDSSVRTTISNQCVKFVEMLHSKQQVWRLYCLLRVALCNNVYSLSHHIVDLLSHYTTSPRSHHFMTSLRLICESEMAGEMSERIGLLEGALLDIQCGENKPQTHFQDRFISLKIRLYKIYLQILNLSEVAEMTKSDKVTSYKPTFNFLLKQVTKLSENIAELKSGMIDADDDLSQLSQICRVLLVLCSGEHNTSCSSNTDDTISRIYTILRETPEVLNSITFIKQTTQRLSELHVPLPMYYFIQEQCTRIAIVTNPPIEEGFIKIPGNGCQLLLTLETIIRGNTHNKIRSIIITVTSDTTSSKACKDSQGDDVTIFTDELTVHDGYVKAELTVGVSPDLYTVSVRAVDYCDNVWNVGSKISFRIKSDESILTKSQMSKGYV